MLDFATFENGVMPILIATDLRSLAHQCQEFVANHITCHSVAIEVAYPNDQCTSISLDSIFEWSKSLRSSDYHERRRQLDPIWQHIQANRGLKTATTPEHLSLLGTQAKRFWVSNVMEPEGWDKNIAFYMWDGDQFRGFVNIRRSFDQPEFDSLEGQFLGMLRAIMASRITELMARERLIAEEVIRDHLVSPHIDLAVLSHDHRVIFTMGNGRQRSETWGLLSNEECEVASGLTKQIMDKRGDHCRLDTSFLARGPSDERAEVTLRRTGTRRSDWVSVVRFAKKPSFGADHGSSDTLPHNWQTLLTMKERDVAVLVRRGMSNKEVAVRLGKSVPTVKMQLQSIFRKTAVVNRATLASIGGSPGGRRGAGRV